jgi:hypothetical protein
MSAIPPVGAAPTPQFPMSMSVEQAVGVYADSFALWNTNETLVMDFAVTSQPIVQQALPNGQPVAILAKQVASRVRIPMPMVMELMKGLNSQLASWEAATGQANPPLGD